jgi:hypothetical protein
MSRSADFFELKKAMKALERGFLAFLGYAESADRRQA